MESRIFSLLFIYSSIHSFIHSLTCHTAVPLVTSTRTNEKDVQAQSPDLSLVDGYDVRLVCHLCSCKRDCYLEIYWVCTIQLYTSTRLLSRMLFAVWLHYSLSILLSIASSVAVCTLTIWRPFPCFFKVYVKRI